MPKRPTVDEQHQLCKQAIILADDILHSLADRNVGYNVALNTGIVMLAKLIAGQHDLNFRQTHQRLITALSQSLPEGGEVLPSVRDRTLEN